MLTDIVKLVIPGVVGGLLLAAVLIRTMEERDGHAADRSARLRSASWSR